MVISLVDYREKTEKAESPGIGEELRKLEKVRDRLSELETDQIKLLDGTFGITSGKPDPSAQNQLLSERHASLLDDTLRSLRKNPTVPQRPEMPKLKLIK